MTFSQTTSTYSECQNKSSPLNQNQFNHLKEGKSVRGANPKTSIGIITTPTKPHLLNAYIPVSMISACKWKGPCCSCWDLATPFSPFRLMVVVELSGTVLPAAQSTGMSVLAAEGKVL